MRLSQQKKKFIDEVIVASCIHVEYIYIYIYIYITHACNHPINVQNNSLLLLILLLSPFENEFKASLSL